MDLTATSTFGLTLLGALALLTTIRPRWALLCFIFLVPCPALPDWLGFDPRLYWAFFIGAMAIVLSIVRHEFRLPRPAAIAWVFFIAIGALVLWLNPSGLTGDDLDAAYSFFRYFVAGSLVFFAFRQLITTCEEMQRFFTAFAGSVLVVSCEGLSEAIRSYAVGGSGRIAGIFGNPNYLAGFMALSVSVLLLIRHQLTPDRSRMRKFLMVVVVFASLCCVSTLSRGGTTALVLGISLHWFFVINPKMSMRRLVLALVPATLTIILLTTSDLMSYRLQVSYSDDPHTTDVATANQAVEDLSRLEAALFAVDLITQRPTFGSGIGTFAAINYKNTGNYIANHDTYLEILTGTGIIGLLLLVRVLWVLGAQLTSSQTRALAGLLGTTFAVGATMDLMQALEFFALFSVAYCFARLCVNEGA